ncbi:MAG TPA: ABC transporter ATP-binding protein [Deinococcales bacterium]|nr:ABC transporter ATP-binding protein [Deinococcales bacterium]
MPAIVASHLRKLYRGREAVADLSINVGHGEVYGFLGPNGAGKTTTVKMLLGLARPSGGTATLLGRPLGDRAARRRIGFLPELFRFHDWLTGLELVRLHGQLHGLRGPDLDRKAREVLNLVGLGGRENDKVGGYSKGMQQRAGLATALVNDPELVFLDEPTSALDPLGRRDVREIISGLRERGVSVFLNSHLLSEVELTCDRVAIVNRGRVLREGSLAELQAGTLEVDLTVDRLDPDLRARLALLGRVLEERPDGLRLRLAERDLIPRVAQAVLDAGARLYGLVPRQASLEELFVRLVQGQGEAT